MTAPVESSSTGTDDGVADASPGSSRVRRLARALKRLPSLAVTLTGRLLPDRRPLRLAVLVLLVLLVAAGGTGVGLLGARVADDHARDEAASSGVRAATDLTPVLLSYDWRTIDADAARIDAAGTGAFADQNRAILAGLVKPAAVQGQAVSKAEVSATALVAADPGRAVVLVYFTQTTTLPSLPGPRVDSRSARVTVVRTDDGRWLVSGFDAV